MKTDFKNERQLIKEEQKQNKQEIKTMSIYYNEQIKKIKSEIPKGNKKIKKNAEKIAKGIYEVPFLIKSSLIFVKLFAYIQMLLFIPFAWALYFINRYDELYYGISTKNKVKLGVNAIIFFGIIPGIIILLCKMPNKINNESANGTDERDR